MEKTNSLYYKFARGEQVLIPFNSRLVPGKIKATTCSLLSSGVTRVVYTVELCGKNQKEADYNEHDVISSLTK